MVRIYMQNRKNQSCNELLAKSFKMMFGRVHQDHDIRPKGQRATLGSSKGIKGIMTLSLGVLEGLLV
jgi:hypothetical protein